MHCIHKMLRAPAIALLLISLPASAGNVANIGKETCMEMKKRNVLKPNAPVECDRLRIVRFSYLDFNGRLQHDGEIMVLDAVASHVLQIFEDLHREGFRMKQARLMQHYAGSDSASMDDNNSSGFNHRQITNGTLPSLHALGLAIDLNPVQNPYIVIDKSGYARFSPAGSTSYANRLTIRPGKTRRHGLAEDAVDIFARHGFTVWGGHWDNPIDYQHFQVPRELANQLIVLPAAKASQLFERHIRHYQDCMNTWHSKSHQNRTAPDCTFLNID